MLRRICQTTRNDKVIRSQKYGLQCIGSTEKEMSWESSAGSYFDKMPDLQFYMNSVSKSVE